MKRFLLCALLCAILAPAAKSQAIWSEADFKGSITKNFAVNLGVEYRTWDQLKGTDRWGASFGLDYKIASWLKADAGFVFFVSHNPWEETAKGNIVTSYWQPKYRGYFSLTGKVRWGRVDFSLRERFQVTRRGHRTVTKYKPNGITPKDEPEEINAYNKVVLRHRFQVAYDIKRSPFEPYASFELYNNLRKGFAWDQWRITGGLDYKFNKAHSLGVYYRYIKRADGVEDYEAKNVIGIDYTLKFKF